MWEACFLQNVKNPIILQEIFLQNCSISPSCTGNIIFPANTTIVKMPFHFVGNIPTKFCFVSSYVGSKLNNLLFTLSPLRVGKRF